MPLIPLPQLLEHALAGGYAVGYFEAWDSYSLEAVVEAAEAESAPAILGFGCMMGDQGWLDAVGIDALAALGRAVAARTDVPVALLLNEAQTPRQAVQGIEAGFNAVMLDTSRWPPDQARAAVAELVAVAHPRGVAVEAELGCLPAVVDGDRIDDSTASLTDPEEAAAFVTATSADCLAVSIGNVHLLQTRSAAVDLERLAAIHRRVSVPLVIHGGTGFPAAAVGAACARGVAKVNVGTILKKSFLAGLRDALVHLPTDPDVHAVLGSHRAGDVQEAAKAGMRAKTRELIRLYGGSGQARRV